MVVQHLYDSIVECVAVLHPTKIHLLGFLDPCGVSHQTCLKKNYILLARSVQPLGVPAHFPGSWKSLSLAERPATLSMHKRWPQPSASYSCHLYSLVPFMAISDSKLNLGSFSQGSVQPPPPPQKIRKSMEKHCIQKRNYEKIQQRQTYRYIPEENINFDKLYPDSNLRRRAQHRSGLEERIAMGLDWLTDFK